MAPGCATFIRQSQAMASLILLAQTLDVLNRGF
jgi:hypothetical protein